MANPPDGGSGSGRDDPPRLNENHLRHLLASCRYIDRLLSEIDDVVTAADSQSPFARYINDLSPTLRKLLRDYFARLRTDMVRILERHQAMPEGDRISAIHAIRVALGFVEISLEELKPRYMHGYGRVPEALEPELNGFAEELKSVVRTLDRALAGGEAGNFETRLTRLQRLGGETAVLKTLERLISEHGLVEFRPALEIVLSRLEEHRFEVAVFGRVSSGKSSLLNHLLDQPILPVGVTPITAVPTRVMHASTSEVNVAFADRKGERTTIERLHEFVTEQENPGNTKHVTRLLVKVPAARLASGIVFVDTPGLGSLATTGAAETLAYLPRCDLAIVLIDAASTLTAEDVNTIQLLQQAAIPAMVVLSKADLLNPVDLERALAYTSRQIQQQLELQIGVHAVSTMTGHEDLLNRWVHDELGPLLSRHQELARQSVRRKVGALRAGVESSLRGRLRRQRSATRETPANEAAGVEDALRQAAGAFEEVRRAIDALDRVQASDVARATKRAAEIVADALLEGATNEPAESLVARVLGTIGAERSDALARLLSTLGDQSRQALTTAAHALHLPQPATDDEWTSIMRELPRLDPGPLTLKLRLVGLNALGRRVAVARVASVLRAQMGTQLPDALETHGHVLRHWGLRAVGRLRQQFETQAQIYRAQLAAAPAETADQAGVEDALRLLEALDPAEARL
jgi:small GTP-binding protein